MYFQCYQHFHLPYKSAFRNIHFQKIWKKIVKGHNLTKTEINDFEYHKPHKSVRKGYLQTSSSWACSFGCNITSILFGIGKWEPVKKIHQYEFHKNTRFIKRRTNSRRSSEIRITGTCNVLSWKEGRKVNEFRGKVATSSSCVQVQTYSHQHRMPQSNILRVYYQAVQMDLIQHNWIGNWPNDN